MLYRTPGICVRCSIRAQRALFGLEPHTISIETPRWHSRRTYSSHVTQSSRPFRVAVIGSGPAGFYATYKLMTKIENAFVDMYEQLPVPFGLVRYGVAPDHPEVKNCQEKFTEVAGSSRFNFIGNIDLGTTLPLKALKPHYDAILFSYGASKDKLLGLPGENFCGIYSARAFVGWYNGLPEYRELHPELDRGEEAVVIGQGNVAMDVARVLLTDVDVLRKTDMAEHALEGLSRSKIKRVRVVGRRGPMQGAYTIKELRELIQLPSVSFEPIPEILFPPPPTIKSLPRAQKRITQLLAKGSPTNSSSTNKSWSLDFLLSPYSFHASDTQPDHLSYIKFTRNQLDPSDPFSPTARAMPRLGDDGKAMQADIPASVCFRSIGYKSLPLQGFDDLNIPFDVSRGIIPNDGQGRVINSSSDPSLSPKDIPTHLPGLYCAGWVKRGPTGVIASTMTDAFDTAEAIVADWTHHLGASSGAPTFLNSGEGGATGLGWDGVRGEAEKLGLRPTSWQDWEAIDRVEMERGQAKGKIREKFGCVKEMLDVL
ncbi:NADPH-adrenodoxin reductase [Ophidiomyces ophidiicola]|uniref:NADPH-adrenodoxin reductase n=1 Tax=Ophidiomyces ophidiicola TaxID=1387563 RepID=UPI0020C4B3C0|nr:NADPH-adrenodoxin reductase [Ophidiomyces ophidiicola]KAI1948508.1 NADPH-adrenodoxin reductase [Ophidiomyces ophidiicola]KAI1953154.1 NADPH-adrenodoxin reductase [Ophidiomyces ophidiicola]KAI2009514.1 NADPH-adrenodoxin reductase [Ophidiomyces ophidiicola]KAI2054825.1 NADPH-adrenodoxin reductase [Ophidiomyces ophidiicola]KAI2078975.1 NADPH-adrenodoxin reductase [Ophidiomyces ophidiicola]